MHNQRSVHFRDEEMEEEENCTQPPTKKRLSPSSPTGEIVMGDLQLPPCAAKDGCASEAFQKSVSLGVDVKTLYSLLAPALRDASTSGAVIRVEAKQLTVAGAKKTFAVICDGSGSMNSENRYSDVSIAVKAAVETLRKIGADNFDVAVIRFDSEASVIYGPAEIPTDAQLEVIIEKLQPSGETDIAKALQVFQEQVSAPQLLKGGSVIGVLITDGEDTGLSRSLQNGGCTTYATRKLGNVSGETIHFLAVSQGADIQLLKTLAEACGTTCNRVTTDGVAGVLGSAIGLEEEKVSNGVLVSVGVGAPGEAKTQLITQQRVNLRYSKDDEPAATDLFIELPSLKEGQAALEVDVKLEVYDYGYYKTGITLPIFTQEKTFTLTAAASEEEFALAMKDPCLEYIIHAAKRVRGSVDEKVAGLLLTANINGAIATVNKGIEDVKKYVALTTDESTIEALTTSVGELEAQRTELESSRNERARMNDIRDRALSDAMTDRNHMAVTGRTQSNSQHSARTLSTVTARTLSNARNDSQDLRSFSNVSAFGNLRVDSMPPPASRSSTGASIFGDMRLGSTTPAVEEEESQAYDEEEESQAYDCN